MNREMILDLLERADEAAREFLGDTPGDHSGRSYCEELLRELELEGYALVRVGGPGLYGR